MVAPAAIGIHCRARHLSQDIRRCARPIHPAKKARMNIPRIIGHDPFKLGLHLLRANPALGKGRINLGFQGLRHRRPNPPLPRAFKLI